MAITEQLVLQHKTAEALCCIVMFESYARPAEAIALTSACITYPVAGARGLRGATSLTRRARDLNVPSKTGAFDDSVALDLPRQAWLGRALSNLARSKAGGAGLWDFDHHSLGRSFSAAADAAGLGPLQACHDRAAHTRSLAAIQLRGAPTDGREGGEHIVDACAFGRPMHARLRVSLSRARMLGCDGVCHGRRLCAFSPKPQLSPGRRFAVPRELICHIVNGTVQASLRLRQSRRWAAMKG